MRRLMTSVFRESGLAMPWSLAKRPQALQRGWPSESRRHRGVVVVEQLVQVDVRGFAAARPSWVAEPPADLRGEDSLLD